MTSIERLVDNTVAQLAQMLEQSVNVQEIVSTAFGLKYLNARRINDNDYNAGRLLRLQKALTGVTMQETMQQLEQLVLDAFQEIVELAPSSDYNDVLLAALSIKDMADSFFNWIVVNEPAGYESIMNRLTSARTEAVAALTERMTTLLPELTLPSQAKLLCKAISTLYDSTNSMTGYEKLLQLLLALDQKVTANNSENSALYDKIHEEIANISATLEDHLGQLTQIGVDLNEVDTRLDNHDTQLNNHQNQINQINTDLVTVDSRLDGHHNRIDDLETDMENHTHSYLPLSGGRLTGDLSVSGEILANGDITAFYSDIRLKEDIHLITGALTTVTSWQGIRFKPNLLASCMGPYSRRKSEIGLIAQEVKKDVPEAVCLAPFDRPMDGQKSSSRSGENYLTIKYYKLIPHLVEAIKELNGKVDTFLRGKHHGSTQ